MRNETETNFGITKDENGTYRNAKGIKFSNLDKVLREAPSTFVCNYCAETCPIQEEDVLLFSDGTEYSVCEECWQNAEKDIHNNLYSECIRPAVIDYFEAARENED